MIIRPATRDDIIEMCGGTFAENIWAMVAEDEGKVLALAGVRYSNPTMCFGNIKPEMKKSPRTIIKLARMVTKVVDESDMPVYAIADKDEPTAPRFLEHVGFDYLMSSRNGEIYKWHQQS